jgi:hypothetical protein
VRRIAELVEFGLFVGALGCAAHGCVEQPPCDQATLNGIIEACTVAEYNHDCLNDPERDCPEVVRACRARVEEWRVCK